MNPARPLILVVDDDPDIRETLRDVLRLEAYRVDTASNGLEALHRARAQHPDLVILDLMMPVMTGWQFREEQLRDPSIASTPVVVVSAARNPRPLEGCLMLAKPFELDEFLGVLRNVLGHPADPPSSGGRVQS